jgi:hypothetical protein
VPGTLMRPAMQCRSTLSGTTPEWWDSMA